MPLKGGVEQVQLVLGCGVDRASDAEVFPAAAGPQLHRFRLEIRSIASDDADDVLHESIMPQAENLERKLAGKLKRAVGIAHEFTIT